MSPVMWPRMRDDYVPGSANPGQSLVKSSSQDAWEPGAEPGGGGGGGAVDSVNGKTGTVVLSASDVGAEPAGSGTGIRNVSGAVTLDATPGLVEIYATAPATVQTVELSAGDAAVFRHLSGEWTYMVVGEHTTWQTIEAAPIPVTADAPTWTDDTVNGGGSWTTPTITGVTYSPASGTATPGQSVTVTATAQPGYTLTGTTSWTHVFPTDPGDTTDPTPGTLGYSNVTDSGFTLTVTGASDDTGLHATPYAFSLDGGTTWTGWQASATYNATDLDADTTYPCRHKVRDAALNEGLGTMVNVTTAAGQQPVELFTDTFTASDGTMMAGRTPAVGYTWASDSTTKMMHASIGTDARITGNKAASTGGRSGSVIEVGNKVRVSCDYVVYTGGGHEVRIGAALKQPSAGGTYGFVLGVDNSGNATLYQGGGYSPAQVGATTTQAATSGTIALEYDGTTVRAYQNNVQFASGDFPRDGTYVGFAFSHSPGSSIDNFKVETIP